VGAWFSFLGFQSWWVDLSVCFATPSKFSMMFRFVWTVAFDTFGILDSAQKCCMSSLPAVFVLWNAGVYIGSLNGCDVVSDIETPID